jgi:hypothetical protein
MQDTAMIEMKIKAASGVAKENTDTAIKKRTGNLPDQFGGDWDGDFDGGGDS